AGIKEVVNAPIIHAQNIKDPTQAVRVLEGGYVDMVGMTRAHIADPHFVNKVREDRVDEIRQCVGANYCIDRQYQGLDVLCIQNAATSREHKGMPHIITKTEGARRKVVVVGGGPGGMEAARVAAERGHDVTLIEKQDALGGQIGIAARAPQRDQIGGITRWFQMELDRLGVDQRLGTTASAESVLALNPDIVVLATGGSPFIDQSPEWGASDGLVLSSWDVLSGAVEPGKNVLIYDPQCEWSGMSVADYCAAKGSLVEIVTDDVKPGLGAGGTTFPTFYRSLYEKEVVMSSDLVLEKVYAEGDKRVAVLKNEYTEQLEERLVDQIIVENGVRPDEALYYALKPDSRNLGQVDVHALFNDRPQPSLSEAGDGYLLFRIGDCVSQRNAHAAIYDALRICKDF
ncbi:MAG: FAD-dependent oxidoreductase, partial [Ectothiorhodospiraceae bacterium]